MEILAAILGAIAGFVFAWFLQSRRIRAAKEASTLEYERGRRDEANRRQHEIDLLTREIDSLNDIEHRKLLIETGRLLLKYFSEIKITTEFQATFPMADASTFNSLLNKYGEQNEHGHAKEMLQFMELIKTYSEIHDNCAKALPPLMQAGDKQAIQEWDEKLRAAAQDICAFTNGVITDVKFDE